MQKDDHRTSWKTMEHELNTGSCSPELLFFFFLNIKITEYYFWREEMYEDRVEYSTHRGNILIKIL